MKDWSSAKPFWSKAATIRWRLVFKVGYYLRTASILGRLLFEDSLYATVTILSTGPLPLLGSEILMGRHRQYVFTEVIDLEMSPADNPREQV